MAAGKVIVGLIFGIITLIGSIFVINNAWSNVIEAEKWVAYEYGACRYANGFTEEECLSMVGEVHWPVINGKQAYDKYYSEPGSWVYGENPRLGLGIAAGNFILSFVYASSEGESNEEESTEEESKDNEDGAVTNPNSGPGEGGAVQKALEAMEKSELSVEEKEEEGSKENKNDGNDNNTNQTLCVNITRP